MYNIISPCCRKDEYSVKKLYDKEVKCPLCGCTYSQTDAIMTINEQVQEQKQEELTNFNNKTCKICGEKFHHCSSCGFSELDYKYDTSIYCSEKCAYK
jgi:hypothetical protein